MTFNALLARSPSVITGDNKCGTSLYGVNSTFLGSIKTNFTSSGFVRIKTEEIIALTQTDLPLPVAPAINKCGIRFNSP